jgi:hypothetical protein
MYPDGAALRHEAMRAGYQLAYLVLLNVAAHCAEALSEPPTIHQTRRAELASGSQDADLGSTGGCLTCKFSSQLHFGIVTRTNLGRRH